MQIKKATRLHPDALAAVEQSSQALIRMKLLEIAGEHCKFNDYDYPQTIAHKLVQIATELEKYVAP